MGCDWLKEDEETVCIKKKITYSHKSTQTETQPIFAIKSLPAGERQLNRYKCTKCIKPIFFENNNLLRRHQKRQHSGKDDAPLKIICHICNRSVQRDNIRQGFFGFLFTDHSGLLSIDLS